MKLYANRFIQRGGGISVLLAGADVGSSVGKA